MIIYIDYHNLMLVHPIISSLHYLHFVHRCIHHIHVWLYHIYFQICMFMSTCYHLFGCRSLTGRRWWLRMDLMGISAGIMGIYSTGIYYAFYCFEVIMQTWLLTCTIINLLFVSSTSFASTCVYSLCCWLWLCVPHCILTICDQCMADELASFISSTLRSPSMALCRLRTGLLLKADFDRHLYWFVFDKSYW